MPTLNNCITNPASPRLFIKVSEAVGSKNCIWLIAAFAAKPNSKKTNIEGSQRNLKKALRLEWLEATDLR